MAPSWRRSSPRQSCPLEPEFVSLAAVAKFPVDAPLERAVRALQTLGFVVVRRGNHVSLVRTEADGTRTPLTLPGHRTIKSSTLRTALTQAGISRESFQRAYEQA